MGVAGSKKLPKEDMQFLMDNTNFTKQQIKAWYKGFMVSLLAINIKNCSLSLVLMATYQKPQKLS